MLKLVNTLKSKVLASQSSNAVPTPDISRVIKDRPFPGDAQYGEAGDEAAMDAPEFRDWLSRDLNLLYTSWTRVKADSDESAWRAFSTAAHNLHGAAASYGYPSIARLCGSLDRLLGDGNKDAGALINLHIEACKAAARLPAGAEDATSKAVCDALEAQVALKAAV